MSDERWRYDEAEIDGGFCGGEYPRLWPPRWHGESDIQTKTPTPEQLADLVDEAMQARARQMRQALDAWQPLFAEMARQVSAALEQLGRDLAPLNTSLRREAPEPDPWERALQARQQRNTGPQRHPHARLGKGSR